MNNQLRQLLALRCAAGAHRDALVKSLRAGFSIEELATDPRFIPHGEHWRVAERQILALRVLRLTIVPIWQLPRAFGFARAPCALFVRGDPTLIDHKGIGIVGSRRATVQTKRWAVACAQQAIDEQNIIVSGGALGIDGAAHMEAIRMGRPTVVYLGVACDRVYPKQHHELFRRVLDLGGALVSEHAPGEATRAVEHQHRNRFIAAHSQRLMVAEAAEKSGSLGTAQWAWRLGVPVWVPEAKIEGQRAGIESLIDQGRARVWTLKTSK